MKRKIISVLLTLVLVLSLTLVTAVPAMAQTHTVILDTSGYGGAEWSTDQPHSGDYSVHLSLGAGGTGMGKITVLVPAIPIGNLPGCPSYFQYNVLDIEPDTFLNIFLDLDGDGIVDDYLEGVSATHGTVGQWTEVSEIDEVYYDSSDSLGSGFTTPQHLTTLADWQTWFATEMPGEVDVVGVKIIYGCPSVGPAEVYIDDVIINNVTYDLEWTHVSPIQVDDDRVQYPDAPFQTIQGAIDCAIAGDTISVYPGTYAEALNINEEVTLTGVTSAGVINRTLLTAGAGATAPTIDYDGSQGHMIAVDANNVTFQGFNIDMAEEAATRAIHFRSLGAALTDNTLIQYNTFTGACRAINVSDDRTVTDLTVTYNKFTDPKRQMNRVVSTMRLIG